MGVRDLQADVETVRDVHADVQAGIRDVQTEMQAVRDVQADVREVRNIAERAAGGVDDVRADLHSVAANASGEIGQCRLHVQPARRANAPER